MSSHSVKVQHAARSPAWQLALDKIPFLSTGTPSLPQTKVEALRRCVGPNPLRKAEWDRSIASRMRTLDLLAGQHGERLRCVRLVNSSRLLLHLGRASVLENVGLYCDRTTGLPVIPGSAVKGVVSTWACWEAHFNESDGSFGTFTESSVERKAFPEGELAARVLGDNSRSGSESAGEIAFLGAWPEEAPVLGLDIVTPHTDASGGDCSPSPNPFLCVEAGTIWRFPLLASPGSVDDSGPLLDLASRWLSEVLEQSGLGAKTASGYGRFLAPEVWDRATKDEAALAAEATKAKADAAREAAAQAFRDSMDGDYDEVSFENAVLKRLSKPQEFELLRREIEKIRTNPDNAPWIPKLTEALRGSAMRDERKRLKSKDWFPDEWLPQ